MKAVWLNPIYESPNKDFGYDISNFTAIDKKYGTMADFEDLVTKLRSKGQSYENDLPEAGCGYLFSCFLLIHSKGLNC